MSIEVKDIEQARAALDPTDVTRQTPTPELVAAVIAEIRARGGSVIAGAGLPPTFMVKMPLNEEERRQLWIETCVASELYLLARHGLVDPGRDDAARITDQRCSEEARRILEDAWPDVSTMFLVFILRWMKARGHRLYARPRGEGWLNVEEAHLTAGEFLPSEWFAGAQSRQGGESTMSDTDAMSPSLDALDPTREHEVKEIRDYEVPRLVGQELKDHFFTDWNERWKSHCYHVVYRIGEVEEAFSFTPDEIDGAIEAAARQFVGASKRGLRMDLTCLIDWIGREDQNLVEYMVRRKHRLPKVLNPPPENIKHAIRALTRSGCVPQDEWQQVVRSMMVFGLVMWFLGRPADHDYLEVTDRTQAECDAALKAGSAVMNADIAGKSLADLKAMGSGLGGRTLSSRCVGAVN
jgi:hypothetical protein